MVAVLERHGSTSITPLALFKPLGWQIQPWRCKDKVILLTGSAGGGKSHLAAEKIHAFCLKYPGAQAIIARKTRVTLINGTILFLEREVIGLDTRVKHVPSKSRFEYTNGSIITYIGINDAKDRSKLRSIGAKGGVDIAWMEEATEFEEPDYNAILARLRGKAAKWRQIILSTNPEGPNHWIYRRLIQGGQATVFESSNKLNTHNPDDYQATLDAMTGVEAERLREGKWVQATGLIYGEVWKDTGDNANVTDEAEYVQDGGVIIWGVDDGYSGKVDTATGYFTGDSHPRVFLLAQLRPNGQLNIFEEHYAVGKLSEQHLEEILALGYPLPDFAAIDKSAAELKGRFHSKMIYTRNGPSSVEETIKVVRNWLAADNNGIRRVHVHPRCKHLRFEMLAYRRDPVNETPIKQFDHGPDALRYLIYNMKVYGE